MHATFLMKYIAHFDFIGDVVNWSTIHTLNSNSCRKLILIHWVQIEENTDPTRISFNELCNQTQKSKYLRSRLPNKTTVL